MYILGLLHIQSIWFCLLLRSIFFIEHDAFQFLIILHQKMFVLCTQFVERSISETFKRSVSWSLVDLNYLSLSWHSRTYRTVFGNQDKLMALCQTWLYLLSWILLSYFVKQTSGLRIVHEDPEWSAASFFTSSSVEIRQQVGYSCNLWNCDGYLYIQCRISFTSYTSQKSL